MSTDLTFGQWAGRWLVRLLIGAVVLSAALYLGDWGIWRVRLAAGGGMGAMVVSRVVVAPLKGNREEYYPDGTGQVACSRSLFPQGAVNACWWVSRHTVIYDR